MKINGKDISQEEWEKLTIPYSDNLEKFLTKLVPMIFAFQLAQSHYMNCLCDATLLQHFNSMTDVILVYSSLEDVKEDTINLLKMCYNLTIINEDPVTLEKWK